MKEKNKKIRESNSRQLSTTVEFSKKKLLPMEGLVLLRKILMKMMMVEEQQVIVLFDKKIHRP